MSDKEYLIQITSKAQKDFRKLDPKVQKAVSKAIYALEKNRFPQQFKPLIGYEIAQFRLRVGDYRVLYDVYDEDKVVLILRVGHRKDFYK